MPRARALVAAVPQRVWTAVAGLVLLASLGVTLVLAAGLSTWQGAVGNTPSRGNAQPPGSVVTPPGSAVIVVPTPQTQRPAPAGPPHPGTAHPGEAPAAQAPPAVVTVALPAAPAPVTTPVATPPAPAPVPPTPVTATPHVTGGDGGVGTGKPVKGKHAQKVKQAHKVKHAHKARHGKPAVKDGDHGRHLGWFKNKQGKHS